MVKYRYRVVHSLRPSPHPRNLVMQGVAVVVGPDGFVANLSEAVERVIENHRHFERIESKPEPVYVPPQKRRKKKAQ